MYQVKQASMTECARCGAITESKVDKWYTYCDECHTTFQQVRKNGVTARSTHGESVRTIRGVPYVVSIGHEVDQTHLGFNSHVGSQVEALGEAKKVMDQYDLPGLFKYNKTGSRWLIEEYLEAHPSIQEDVEEYMSSDWKDLLSGIFS